MNCSIQWEGNKYETVPPEGVFIVAEILVSTCRLSSVLGVGSRRIRGQPFSRFMFHVTSPDSKSNVNEYAGSTVYCEPVRDHYIGLDGGDREVDGATSSSSSPEMSGDHRTVIKGSPSQYVKLNTGGSLHYTTIGTLTKHDTMLRAMFSGRMEVLTDSEGT